MYTEYILYTEGAQRNYHFNRSVTGSKCVLVDQREEWAES